nr:2-oxoisovalerate dehydrogenase [Candidatus Nitrospira allomarina]
MSEIIFLVEDAPEGGVTARALGESIFTEADYMAELHTKVRDAVKCHFDEDKAPKIIRPTPRARRSHRGMKLPRNLPIV